MNAQEFPAALQAAMSLAHPSWLPTLQRGLRAVHEAAPAYLDGLVEGAYLPTRGRLFAAFSQPITSVRYVLIGEGPYPREASATGVCFMDGAVQELWSPDADGGLSKKVNRATSLRNFIKMLLVADGRLNADQASGAAVARIAQQARAPGSGMIATLAELQSNLEHQGFLLLNASLVYRDSVAPVKDAKAWQPFLGEVLAALHSRTPQQSLPLLILWGKIAEALKRIELSAQFPHIAAEHPYNLSFIGNSAMHALFSPMHLLQQG